jgi:hypothetical protein
VGLKGLKESTAGQLIGEFIAAVRRRYLFQDMVAPQGDIQPADAR